MRALGDLVPVLDPVVRDVQGRELLERRHVVKSLNLVVGEPELFESCGDILQILDSLDVVTSEGKNFQILKALHGDDLLDRVRGEGKLLAVLKLIDFIIKLLERVGELAHQLDLRSLLRRDAALGLPSADCFSK